MAMNLGTEYSNMQAAEAELGGYTKDLPGQIESQIQTAWAPSLKEAVGVTQRQMGEFLPKYFQMGESLGGTTAADLSPTQKLGVMGSELGTMGGRLVASQRYSDYLGGQMKDMYGKAIEAMRMGQQNAANAYSRAFQRYQLAWQEAENAKARASSRVGSGTPGINWGDLLEDKSPTLREALLGIDRRGIGKGERTQQANQIFAQYGINPSFGGYEMAGFSDKWNPYRSQAGTAAKSLIRGR